MSQENVEVARRLYPDRIDWVAALADPKAAKALEDALTLVHPDFETVTAPGQVPLSGVDVEPEDALRQVAYGVSGFVNAFRDWLSGWETWVVTPTEFIDVDENRVLVIYDIRARSKTHQAEMPFEGAALLTLKDGKLARSEMFNIKQEALEAAGLSE
jgi:ketosteroid isomerase-like protein